MALLSLRSVVYKQKRQRMEDEVSSAIYRTRMTSSVCMVFGLVRVQQSSEGQELDSVSIAITTCWSFYHTVQQAALKYTSRHTLWIGIPNHEELWLEVSVNEGTFPLLVGLHITIELIRVPTSYTLDVRLSAHPHSFHYRRFSYSCWSTGPPFSRLAEEVCV